MANQVFIFCGLSLSFDECKKLCPTASILPPIRRGDLEKLPSLMAGEENIVVIIDGKFHSSEAVSISEIRRLIATGWKVFGASSLGALRATEAVSIGMIGAGAVFRWFKLLKVEDDDEVAQTMEANTFYAMSLAMVDIRYMVRSFRRSGEISAMQAEQICADLKDLHYPARTSFQLSKAFQKYSGVVIDPESWRMHEKIKHKDAQSVVRFVERYITQAHA